MLPFVWDCDPASVARYCDLGSDCAAAGKMHAPDSGPALSETMQGLPRGLAVSDRAYKKSRKSSGSQCDKGEALADKALATPEFERCPDGRKCNLCPRSDTDNDPVLGATTYMFWGRMSYILRLLIPWTHMRAVAVANVWRQRRMGKGCN